MAWLSACVPCAEAAGGRANARAIASANRHEDCSSLDRSSYRRQFGRWFSRSEGSLQEIHPFLELLELRLELSNTGVGGGSDGSPTPDAFGERARDWTEDPDEDPAEEGKPTKVNECEVVHDAPRMLDAAKGMHPSGGAERYGRPA